MVQQIDKFFREKVMVILIKVLHFIFSKKVTVKETE